MTDLMARKSRRLVDQVRRLMLLRAKLIEQQAKPMRPAKRVMVDDQVEQIDQDLAEIRALVQR